MFLASGADEGQVGINTCVLTYHPQAFRYTDHGMIVSDDFCFTMDEAKAGSSVSTSLINILIDTGLFQTVH